MSAFPQRMAGTADAGRDDRRRYTQGSRTAMPIDATKEPLDKVLIRASIAQAELLVAWAAWPERSRAQSG